MANSVKKLWFITIYTIDKFVRRYLTRLFVYLYTRSVKIPKSL